MLHGVPSLVAPQHVRVAVFMIPSLLRVTIENGVAL
jgi:hypothetical protein